MPCKGAWRIYFNAGMKLQITLGMREQGGLMDRMGPEMLEKPGRTTHPIPHNHNQSKECSQQSHPRAIHTNCLSVPVKGSGTPEAPLLFPDIISLLTSDDREIRITTIAALGRLGDIRAIEPRFRACMDDDDLVKQAAREALAAIAIKSR
jgi:hypothetical protein